MLNPYSTPQPGALRPYNRSATPSFSPPLAYAPPQPDQFIKAAVPRGITSRPARLSLPQWQTFPTGLNNAITDVPGVKIGQLTYAQDFPDKIHTGVTAIVPDAPSLTQGQGNLATTGFKASAVCLNGNGELTGTSFINEFGVLNSPILLTNTQSVGALHTGVNHFFNRYFPGQWSGQLPVIGECYDGFFNTVQKDTIPPQAAEMALNQATSGPVLQGRVGAGAGMRSFELHAGIGSASRKIVLNGNVYTLGVLVNMNHSHLNDLNPVIRQQLETRLGPLESLKAKDNLDGVNAPPINSPRQGSIQVVIATDLPLNNKQLEELAKRAGLGIGNTGSIMSTSSGDFATAFTTANPIPMGSQVPALLKSTEVHPDEMTPIFKAAVEAVTESEVNALMASHS